MKEKAERLKKAIMYLLGSGVITSQKMVSDIMNANQVSVSKALAGQVGYLTDSFIHRFNLAFNEIFNEEWIRSGEGEMIKNAEQSQIKSSIQSNLPARGVPYFDDMECTGTILSMYTDVKEQPAFYIDYAHFNDCTAYVPVVGDSMYPNYCSGEIVAVKQINNLDVIQWGESYLVVTNDNANNLRTIKQIHYCEDESKIILRASNPNYRGDTVIPKEDIVSLFIIKGKIKRNQL